MSYHIDSYDGVYMSDARERQEYIMEDFGIMFVGTASHISYRRWIYGQFEDNMLNICFQMLDQSLNYKRNPVLDVSKRNDPAYVGRVLSAMVNSNDDNGVVLGSWSEDYLDGTSPTSWNGSVSILRQWFNSGYQPVKYGQCWVFAGVMCTVLRCLGIGARCISNFNSAHDTDKNLKIETYVTPFGEPAGMSSDSVWNFHVWNEGWFQRPDLGATYDGWQVLDATPQETSDGIFCLGPTSLHAIKEGDVQLPYDAPFVFSEVNADYESYIVYDSGYTVKTYTSTKLIGKNISTKDVGSDVRIDVTRNYKFDEDSSEERRVYRKALSMLHSSPGFRAMSAAAATAAPAKNPEVSGQISWSGSPVVGDDIKGSLTFQNLSAATKNVKASRNVSSIYYTRRQAQHIWKDSQSFLLFPNEVKEIDIHITYDQYKNRLTKDNMIQVTVVCEIDQGGNVIVEKVITLENPPIIIKALGEAKKGKKLEVEITLSSPLNEPLKDCILTAEGCGLTEKEVKMTWSGDSHSAWKYSGDSAAEGLERTSRGRHGNSSRGALQSWQRSFTGWWSQCLCASAPSLNARDRIQIRFEITPFKAGERQLLVNFTSDKLQDVKGFAKIIVTDPTP
ncbi:protein-glutamine gamma-glutamyltransferase E-like [Rhinatrema bivittatum]|uniref:protein-glutamine gamma-glutamyltransferase E-like n=1 Tax=Rhinatrema bivittatum TaxID=194408 RepID=UPI001126F29F|nr:protein-glutamine gamma-glutamyltransferase E-like [Rhinatrema bivittatum]